jgi:cell division protein FtsB
MGLKAIARRAGIPIVAGVFAFGYRTKAHQDRFLSEVDEELERLTERVDQQHQRIEELDMENKDLREEVDGLKDRLTEMVLKERMDVIKLAPDDRLFLLGKKPEGNGVKAKAIADAEGVEEPEEEEETFGPREQVPAPSGRRKPR